MSLSLELEMSNNRRLWLRDSTVVQTFDSLRSANYYFTYLLTLNLISHKMYIFNKISDLQILLIKDL